MSDDSEARLAALNDEHDRLVEAIAQARRRRERLAMLELEALWDLDVPDPRDAA